MSRDPYDDPYNRSNQYYPSPANEAYNYADPAYHEQHDNALQYNASTEKVLDEYPINTERERKGRAGLRPGTSWGAGPPPRSTGILRMWRKDERGKQWSRVGDWPKSVLSSRAVVSGLS